MKKKLLIISLAMNGFVAGQGEISNITCNDKCTAHHGWEDDNGNAVHNRDCVAEVTMENLDPCLFDKLNLKHPLEIEVKYLRSEIEILREKIVTQEKYLDIIRKNEKK